LVLGLLMATTTMLAASTANAGVSPQEPKPWTVPARKARIKNPVEKSAAAIESGRQLYATNCVVCHGAEGKGDGAAAAALKPKPADFSSTKIQADSDGTIFWKLSKGRAPMPAFNPALSDTQRWELVHYIRSLGSPPTPEEASLNAYAGLRNALEKGDHKAFQKAAKTLKSALATLQDPSKAPGLTAEKAKALHQDWAARMGHAVTPLRSITARKAEWADAPKMFLATTQGLAEVLDLIPTKRLPYAIALWQDANEPGVDQFWLQWEGKKAHNPYAKARRMDGKAVKSWKPSHP